MNQQQQPQDFERFEHQVEDMYNVLLNISSELLTIKSMMKVNRKLATEQHQHETINEGNNCKYRTRAIISRGLYFFFTQFSLWLRLILQTVYVLKMEILHFLSSKSAADKREQLQIESGL